MLPLSATATAIPPCSAAATTEGRCSRRNSRPFQLRIRMPAVSAFLAHSAPISALRVCENSKTRETRQFHGA